MHGARCSFTRIPWLGVLSTLAAFCFFSQIAAGQSVPASPAASATQAACAPNAQVDIPLGATIQAKVAGVMDSAHLKVGKEFWVTVVNGQSYPGCKLLAGAAIYGHIASAVSQASPNPAEMSLVFDRAECDGRGKKEVPMRLIGLIGPSEESARLHDDLPMGALNGKRSASTATKISTFDDYKLNPGGAPNTVRPGAVLGLPKLKLEVEGGPGCSARISSTDRTSHIEAGSQMILLVQRIP